VSDDQPSGVKRGEEGRGVIYDITSTKKKMDKKILYRQKVVAARRGVAPAHFPLLDAGVWSSLSYEKCGLRTSCR
jgi:hypothetical protein